jgi:subtilase family serine protease
VEGPGCAKRTIVDVSAVSDPDTGVAVYTAFGGMGPWLEVGGTSMASAIVAGVYALAGDAASVRRGSEPYRHPQALYDVTSGASGSYGGGYLCTAKAGYDGPSGLGTPNGTGAF